LTSKLLALDEAIVHLERSPILGGERSLARLRVLRREMVSALARLDGQSGLPPPDPRFHCPTP